MVPALRVRIVNVTDLMILCPHGTHPHALSDSAFDNLFTKDKPIHFNYHGYPLELEGLLFKRVEGARVTLAGYSEEGTTTSPFDMMLCNFTSRFHVAATAVRRGALHNPKVAVDAQQLDAQLLHLAAKEREWILANGKDHDDIFDTPKF